MRGPTAIIGRRRCDRRANGVKHPARPPFNLGIGKPHDVKALTREPGITFLITQAVIVSGTIGLDDQPMPQAKKIDDVSPDRDLSSKLEAIEAPVAQQFPQRALV